MDNPVIYGADRVRRLRIALGVAAGLGVITGVICLLVATQVDEDGADTYAVVLGIVSALSILCAVINWRLLATPTATTKRGLVVTGGLYVFFALFTFQVAVGLLFAVVGLVVVFLAVVAEEDAAT